MKLNEFLRLLTKTLNVGVVRVASRIFVSPTSNGVAFGWPYFIQFWKMNNNEADMYAFSCNCKTHVTFFCFSQCWCEYAVSQIVFFFVVFWWLFVYFRTKLNNKCKKTFDFLSLDHRNDTGGPLLCGVPSYCPGPWGLVLLVWPDAR